MRKLFFGITLTALVACSFITNTKDVHAQAKTVYFWLVFTGGPWGYHWTADDGSSIRDDYMAKIAEGVLPAEGIPSGGLEEALTQEQIEELERIEHEANNNSDINN